MADTAFQTQYRQEFVQGFEARQSLTRDSVTTEVEVKGNSAVFLVADSGGATAVTRGTNGKIPGRADNLAQKTATLREWHDVPERTGFNLFASQGDGRRIMQETSMGVINRKIDSDIITILNTGTVDTGSAITASLKLVLKAKAILGVAKVPNDGQITVLATPAFMAYMLQVKEFASAEYVTKKPLDTGDTGWKDAPGFYSFMGLKFIEHPDLPGVGTNAEKCFMYHRSAVGHAAPSDLIQTFAGYDERHDFSWARCTAYMGAALLQNSGIVVMNHDGSEFVGQ
jgi:hypothetical protein